MDTSGQYILMCKKAKEIQNRVWQTGDNYVGSYNRCGHSMVDIGDDIGIHDGGNPDPNWRKSCGCLNYKSFTWLPRQDQLQEMIDGDWNEVILKFSKFSLSISPEKFIAIPVWYLQMCSSMEQLWLVFVMREKFKMVWSREEWVLTHD